MRSMSIFPSILCINVAFSSAQYAHYHQWNHHASRGPVSLSSTASTAPSSTPSVAVAELDSSPSYSSVAASSAPSGTSGTASSSAANGSTSTSSLTPKGNKAGLGGFPDIQINNKAALDQYAPYISWYSDYWPNTTDYPSGQYTIKGIGMLWGNGDLNETDPTAPIGDAAQGDKDRYAAFEALPTSPGPEYMMGFYEPDWQAPYSSNMNPPTAATAWRATLGKLTGSLIGSPSMATQLDEKWLEPFMAALGVSEPPWDFTVIHTNKNSSDGVMADVGYYWSKYKKPVWVSEFACVNDHDWTMCDQDTINTFIPEVVDFFQGNASVVAFGYSNGAGLGTAWPAIDTATGGLTKSGECYLDVLKGVVGAGTKCTN
ncbi:glycosyl hydrolase catalytic core-domain-containing protein [Usnea florida]